MDHGDVDAEHHACRERTERNGIVARGVATFEKDAAAEEANIVDARVDAFEWQQKFSGTKWFQDKLEIT